LINDSKSHSLSLEQAVGQKILLAFKGKESLSNEMLEAIRKYKQAGFSPFRAFNIASPAQARHLTSEL